MFCRFVQAIGSWEKDQLYEVPDEVARSFIGLKYCAEVPASEFLTASRAAADTALKDDILKSVKELLGETRSKGTGKDRPAPPSGGGHVNFQKIAAGEDPAETEAKELARKRGGVASILRSVGIAGHPDRFAPELCRHHSRLLQEMSDEVTEYRFNDDSGTFDIHITRQLEGGGVETVTRTGTDSLSGGSTYGFAVKPEYLSTLFEISMEQQVFVDKAQRIPITQGLEAKWPAWDQYKAPTVAAGIVQPAVFAGVQLYYLGEAAQRTASDASLDMINFKVVDLTAFWALSRDFVSDNYLSMDAAITRMVGRAFGWMEDYMGIQGPGLGTPQGFLNGPATLVVNRAASSKIRPVDLTNMIASISPMVWNDLCWITNITTFPQLSILSDGTNYVFQPNALISQALKLSAMDRSQGGRGAELMHRPMGDLLGFPLYFSEKVPVLGTTGDLSLVAASQFGVAERAGMEFSVSEHFYYDTDRIAYKGKKRHDMKTLWRAPYQQADGSNTKVAPMVTLH